MRLEVCNQITNLCINSLTFHLHKGLYMEGINNITTIRIHADFTVPLFSFLLSNTSTFPPFSCLHWSTTCKTIYSAVKFNESNTTPEISPNYLHNTTRSVGVSQHGGTVFNSGVFQHCCSVFWGFCRGWVSISWYNYELIVQIKHTCLTLLFCL